MFWFGGDPRWQPPGDGAPLSRTVRADVCIVGGGFSGLWAAYWIKRLAPGADVVLLEREFCGAGASGRNGGWVNGWEDSIGTLVSRFGAESATWLLEASVGGAEAMREAVREGGIDCDLAFEGALIVALSAAQLDGLRDLPEAAARIGHGDLIRVLSAEDAQEACGSPRAVGGLLLTKAGSVQPALLVQGLRRLAVQAGVRVFEASPMTRLERGLPAVVETPAGTVVADQVVLTCGPWLAGLRELRRTLFIIPSHVVATAPAPEALDAMGWRRGRPFADARTAVHYGQRTGDDRLVFGRGGGRLGFAGRIVPAHFHDRAEIAAVVADLHDLLPGSRQTTIEWQWGGPVERTQHGTPVGRGARLARQHPLRHGLLGQRRVPHPARRPHPGLGRAGPLRRVRCVAAGERAALVPAAGAGPLPGRPRRPRGHQPLRGPGRQGARARPGLAARQPRPRLLDAQDDPVAR